VTVIHPTAILDPDVELGEGVRIGPYAVLGSGVKIGAWSVIGPHTVIEGECELGERCLVYPHAVLGTPPQDLKYRGEKTRLVFGDGSVIRESVTVNRGTPGGGGLTSLGPNCYLMAHSHVAHDCALGREVVLANNVALAGHVTVGDCVQFGGLAGIHQFVRIGSYAFIGAGAMVRRDVPPFALAKGDRAFITGINRVGLERHGFSPERIEGIEALFNFIAENGRDRLQTELPDFACIQSDLSEVRSFLEQSKLGLCPFRS